MKTTVFAVMLIMAASRFSWASDLADFQPTARLGLDLRADLLSAQTSNSNLMNSELDKFVFSSSRINLLGQLSKNTTYRVRFDAANSLSGANDNVGSAINYLYITQKDSDLVTIRAGKQFIVTSGWEFNYDTSKIYHYGETFLKVPAYYETGLAVELHFNGQIIGLQAANSEPDANIGNQHSYELTRGVYWYGSFNNNKIQPIASLMWFPRVRGIVNGNEDTAAMQTQYAIGSWFNLKPFDFDISIGDVRLPRYTFYTASSTNVHDEEEWLGLVFNAHYRAEESKWQPFTKVTYDHGTVEGNTRSNYLRGSLGVEYYPESTKWWYHATYTFQDNDDSAVSSLSLTHNDQKVNQFMVGAGVYFY